MGRFGCKHIQRPGGDHAADGIVFPCSHLEWPSNTFPGQKKFTKYRAH